MKTGSTIYDIHDFMTSQQPEQPNRPKTMPTTLPTTVLEVHDVRKAYARAGR